MTATAGGAYTPGLKVVAAHAVHARDGSCRFRAPCVVKPGDRVEARQVVAETFMPGDITPLNLAKLLSMPPARRARVHDSRRKASASSRARCSREPRASSESSATEYKREIAGTIESISAVTGQVIIRGAPLPVQVKAYLTGQVVEVFPNEGCVDRSRRHVRPGHLRHRRRDVRPHPHGVQAARSGIDRRSDHRRYEGLRGRGRRARHGTGHRAGAHDRRGGDRRRRHRRPGSRGVPRLRPRRGHHRLRADRV